MGANKRFERREIKIVGDVACVPLGGWRGKDQYALVDIRDVPVVEKYQWRLSGSKNNHGGDIGYVIADVYGQGGRVHKNRSTHKRVFMHHMILGKPPVGRVTDHINRNKQDNRRVNLRHATYSESTYNRTVPKKYNKNRTSTR